MASAVNLADIKAHLRVDHADEDTVIGRYLSAAQAYVSRYLRRDLDTEFPDGWPFEADQAVRLLTCHWYEHREPTADGGAGSALPHAVKDLLSGLRCLA
ncbi:uncharacterized phage protein (possible DNA packaging) [Yoonia tamlensis]|uniref:Uncharacterized phage protein (Possible DNA packaging) n=1 Tax=Yoonia tamlensis TaxID=390270 RepID=A0A1I6GEK3_9RHOB|nr:head-tail connector protein [Yoonia tamlensis]SFR40517.1 uncharacterized phage protein (possible DNA packaging) [Yoonia tamlensis]